VRDTGELPFLTLDALPPTSRLPSLNQE
jgi:hypothetical protein